MIGYGGNYFICQARHHAVARSVVEMYNDAGLEHVKVFQMY